MQVAAGEAIFNNAQLTVPPDLVGQLGAGTIHCTTCHAVNNLGNHPDANFLVRIGTDSVQIIQGLVDNPGTSTVVKLQSMLDRVAALPQYCLRPFTRRQPDLESCIIDNDHRPRPGAGLGA